MDGIKVWKNMALKCGGIWHLSMEEYSDLYHRTRGASARTIVNHVMKQA